MSKDSTEAKCSILYDRPGCGCKVRSEPIMCINGDKWLGECMLDVFESTKEEV